MSRRNKILGFSTVALLGAALFLLTLINQRPEPLRFLHRGRVILQEEWIETGGLPGPGSLKTGGIYRLAGDMDGVGARAASELFSKHWVLEKGSVGQKSFRKGRSVITLMPRPQDHEVTVHLQEYRRPTVGDRIRLWLNGVLRRSKP